MDTEISDKLTIIDGRVAVLEGRTNEASLEVRVVALEVRVGAVEVDASRDRAQVGNLAKKVDELTVTQQTQLEILKRLDAITSNPHFKVILAVVATALASWAASKGLK